MLEQIRERQQLNKQEGHSIYCGSFKKGYVHTEEKFYLGDLNTDENILYC